jgi:hypothetical protein
LLLRHLIKPHPSGVGRARGFKRLLGVSAKIPEGKLIECPIPGAETAAIARCNSIACNCGCPFTVILFKSEKHFL